MWVSAWHVMNTVVHFNRAICFTLAHRTSCSSSTCFFFVVLVSFSVLCVNFFFAQFYFPRLFCYSSFMWCARSMKIKFFKVNLLSPAAEHTIWCHPWNIYNAKYSHQIRFYDNESTWIVFISKILRFRQFHIDFASKRRRLSLSEHYDTHDKRDAICIYSIWANTHS